MKNHFDRHYLILTMLSGLFFFGCTQKTDDIKSPTISETHPQPPRKIEEVVVEEPKLSPPITPKEKMKPSNDQFWIATLKSSNNRVDFKSNSEFTWQNVIPEMNFYRFDSLQTHQQSTALIRYLSKSEIDVKEKTLLVFDEDPGFKKKKSDRVILKTGDLIGKTNTELWVLTDSGLVQITADKTKTAKARVQIKNDQFKVAVEQGSALVTVKTAENEVQKIAVAQNNSVDLNPQTQLQPLTENKNATENDQFAQIIDQSNKIEKPIEQKVLLDRAEETEMTKKSVYQLSGKLSAVGAKLLINGQLVSIDSDLKFTKEMTLTKGTNLIVLQVIRSDSTTQFIRKKVVLED